jgi:hypothetical protein
LECSVFLFRCLFAPVTATQAATKRRHAARPGWPEVALAKLRHADTKTPRGQADIGLKYIKMDYLA